MDGARKVEHSGPVGRAVTSIVIQAMCPVDPIEHDLTPNDPVVL